MSALAPAVRIVGLTVALVLGAVPAVAQEEDVTIFNRPGPSAPGGQQDGNQDLNAIQLSGISTLGGQSMFNFVDTRTNRSFWVPLKGTVNGFTVLSYEPGSDTVVVDRGGMQRSVRLRQAKIVSMAAPVTQAPAPVVEPPMRPPSGMPATVVRTPDGGEIANPKTPQEIAQAETEARMMVSDLLEISMQERARQKALREQRRQQQQQQQQQAPAAAEGR